jgi:hypothetical protein
MEIMYINFYFYIGSIYVFIILYIKNTTSHCDENVKGYNIQSNL